MPSYSHHRRLLLHAYAGCHRWVSEATRCFVTEFFLYSSDFRGVFLIFTDGKFRSATLVLQTTLTKPRRAKPQQKKALATCISSTRREREQQTPATCFHLAWKWGDRNQADGAHLRSSFSEQTLGGVSLYGHLPFRGPRLRKAGSPSSHSSLELAVSSLLNRMLEGGVCFLEQLYRLYSWKEKHWYLRGNYHHLPRLQRQQRQESHSQSQTEGRTCVSLATLPGPEASRRESFNISLMILSLEMWLF